MVEVDLPSYFEEITDQPRALEACVEFYCGREGSNILKTVAGAAGRGRKRRILLTGMGSSYYASMIAAAHISSGGPLAAAIETSELFHYQRDEIDDNVLLVAVSQSGESVEIKKLVEAVRGRCFIAGVTNEPESSLGRAADAVMPLKAGAEEKSATKTYTNSIATLLALAEVWRGGTVHRWREALGGVVSDMAAYVDRGLAQVAEAVEFLQDADYVNLIARGPAVATACQALLLLQETSHVNGGAVTAATFRHGPFEVVGPGHQAIVFAPRGKTYELVAAMATEMASLGSRVLLITNGDFDNVPAGMCVVRVSAADELYAPLLDIMPVELITVGLGPARGVKAGDFSRGHKVTTRE